MIPSKSALAENGEKVSEDSSNADVAVLRLSRPPMESFEELSRFVRDQYFLTAPAGFASELWNSFVATMLIHLSYYVEQQSFTLIL